MVVEKKFPIKIQSFKFEWQNKLGILTALNFIFAEVFYNVDKHKWWNIKRNKCYGAKIECNKFSQSCMRSSKITLYDF